MRERIWAAVLLLVLSASLPGLLCGQFRFDSWTTENGLPQNSIWGLRQTRDGYLWMTTLSSMVRFDGLRFREFNRRNTPGLTADGFSAYALLEDREGCLWAGSLGGAVRYCNGVFTTLTTKDGLPRNGVVRIDEDEEGAVWIYTNPGLAKWKDGRLVRVAPAPGSPLNDIPPASRKNVGVDGFRFGLWKVEKSGWQRFSHGQWRAFPLPAGVADATTLEIDSIVEDSKGRLWYRFRGDLTTYYALHRGQVTTYTGMPRENSVSYQDDGGNIWQSSHEGQTNLVKDGRITPLERFQTSYVFRALEDAERSLWLGTNKTGLFRASPRLIHVVPPHNEISPELNEISTVLQDRDGSIWFGSRGLFHLSGGALRAYYHRGAVPLKPGGPARGLENLVSALFQDRDGTIWAGTRDGLARLEGGFLVSDGPYTAIRGVIQAIHRDRAGVLWAGARSGLYQFKDGVMTHMDRRHGLGPDTVSAILEGRDGTLWVGTSAGLFRSTESGFARPVVSHPSGSHGMDDQDVTAIYEDEAGVLWIGTASYGLYRLEAGRLTHITESNGLASSNIFQIVEDGNHYFWLPGHAGIQRVKREDLDALAAGRNLSVASTTFGKLDGMNSAACSSLGKPSAIRARDGTLWFATDDGIAVLDPRAAQVNLRPPPVRVEEWTIDGRASTASGAVTLNPGQRSLDIQYTALSFVKSNQIRFRYRMEGLDADWIEAGTRRTAYYTRIPPGSYTFRVIAANSDGVWNHQGASLAVEVLPAVYQTWWFQLGVMLAASASVAAAWRYRVSQLQRVQALQRAFSTQLIASQEEERKRIAAELHDSIGQRLVIVKNLAMFFLRAQGEDAVSSGKLRQIEEISSEAAMAIDETREISYDLRPFQLDRLGLTKAIEGIVRTFSAASSMRITQKLDNIDDVFPEELRINFYRIVQESLSNVMKHSQATEVSIEVERKDGEVVLSIRDNGGGFTPGAEKPGSERGGFGITGMAERARSLGGRMTIQSTPGQGSRLSVRIPVTAAEAGEKQ